jgi:hypothetical protein
MRGERRTQVGRCKGRMQGGELLDKKPFWGCRGKAGKIREEKNCCLLKIAMFK